MGKIDCSWRQNCVEFSYFYRTEIPCIKHTECLFYCVLTLILGLDLPMIIALQEFERLNSNEIECLYLEYILEQDSVVIKKNGV